MLSPSKNNSKPPSSRRDTRYVQLSIILLTSIVAAQDQAPAPWFTEIGETAGFSFSHVSGARGEYWFPEIMGGGVGLLDYDGDGLLDIYCVQSGYLPDAEGNQPDSPPNQLFRNPVCHTLKM